VLNHHLLMSDLAMRQDGGSFLPQVDAVIVDEAHDLEDTAAEHLGRRVTWRGVRQLLGRLWSGRGRSGLLAPIDLPRGREAVETAARATDEFFEAVSGDDAAAEGGRLEPGRTLTDGLSPLLDTLSSLLLSATRGLRDRESAMELTARARAVAGAAAALRGLALDDDPEQVRWIEATGEGRTALCSAPVEVGPRLRKVLFDAHESVVLTSATLTVGDPPGFAYLRERLGVAEADESRIGTPFRYRECVRVRVRADLPDPAKNPQEYASQLGPAVLDAVRFSRGDALVLFTSIRDMRRVADEIRAEIEAMDLALLVQGEDLERPALLDAFRRGGAVLFGVASFWQGVDVPGDALRHVVIARLPFEVPTHPLQKARAERLEAQGRSPFRDLSLPAAALRLKQGFGRLIRRHGDSGWVTILDSRVARRSYGRTLLASLPECPVDLLSGAADPREEEESAAELGSDPD
jgi:ATP-dependent DNA helicase DinG